MKTHHLKTLQPYFDEIAKGVKTFECRYNDRDYQVGDHLRLVKYDPLWGVFADEVIIAEVIYILKNFDGCQAGYVIMSINVISIVKERKNHEIDRTGN